MDNKQYKTVVQGEASESDSEEEELTNEPKSVVIEGEAEESDEEELDTTDTTKKKDLSALKVSEYSTSFDALDEVSGATPFAVKKYAKPKHDTVLNRKLWDSNLSLCNNLNSLVSQTYLTAAKDITNCSNQVARSHTLVQDVSHSMRLMTNDLFNLHDRIDIVTSCQILPSITIQSKSPSTPSAVQSPTDQPAGAGATSS